MNRRKRQRSFVEPKMQSLAQGIMPTQQPLYLWWLIVSLAVFVVLPGMYSATYMPKLAWVALSVGVAWVFIPPIKASEIRITRFGVLWLGYLAWALFSLSWAPQLRVGFERWLVLVLWSCCYMLALRTRFWESRRFWSAFQWLFLIVCLIGCLQFLSSGLSILRWIPGSGLPSSTMGHRNYACIYLSLTLPFIVWHLYRSKGMEQVFSMAAVAAGIAFLLFTRAREAWIACMVSALFMLFFGAWSKLRTHAAITKRLVISGIVLLIPLLFLTPAQEVFERGWRKMPLEKKSILTTLASTLEKKSDPRLEMWSNALYSLQSAQGPFGFVLGFGFGNYPIASTPFQSSGVRTLDYEVHNDYLQALVDLGLPGLALFCAIFVQLLWLSWRGRSSGLILASGGAVMALVVIQLFTFTSENVSPILWMAGIAALLNAQPCAKSVYRFSVNSLILRPAQYAVGLFLLLFGAIAVQSIWAERQFYKDNEESRQAGQPMDLKRLAHDVLPKWHFNATIAFVRSHVCAQYAAQMKDWDTARIFAQRALYYHPNDFGSMRVMAKVKAMSEDIYASIPYLESAARASRSYPNPPLWRELLNAYQMAEMPEKAHTAKSMLAQQNILKTMDVYPSHEAKDVPLEFEFEWEPIPYASHYSLYFWKSGDPFPRFPQAAQIKENHVRFQMQALPATDYKWMVKTFGRTGQSTSDIWSFRTANSAK